MVEPKPELEWDVEKVDEKTNKQHVSVVVVPTDYNIDEEKTQIINS